MNVVQMLKQEIRELDQQEKALARQRRNHERALALLQEQEAPARPSSNGKSGLYGADSPRDLKAQKAVREGYDKTLAFFKNATVWEGFLPDLAETLGLTKSRVYRGMALLIEEGLVERTHISKQKGYRYELKRTTNVEPGTGVTEGRRVSA